MSNDYDLLRPPPPMGGLVEGLVDCWGHVKSLKIK